MKKIVGILFLALTINGFAQDTAPTVTAPEKGKTPKAEKVKKEIEFHNGIMKIKDIVKNYTYKYGTFVVNDPESISAGISFYDTNFFGQSNFIGEAKYPPSVFMKKAYELGFSKEGRWIYEPNYNTIFLYKKSQKGTINDSNSFMY